jgi:NADPH-dependent curcumin reductase
MTTAHHIVLASRPQGQASESNFLLKPLELPALGSDEVLVKNHYLSLDPYMRGRMDDVKSYAQPQALDHTMIGGTVGEVIQSNSPRLAVGDHVVGMLGWATHGIAKAAALQKIDTRHVPISAYLGAVGMPGVTAWHGVNQILVPKPGETVVVSAAAGAVGSVVGQLAKQLGARAVGIAGGATKCALVVNEYGFDACIDYQSEDFRQQLKATCPSGIDAYFDNVGGPVLDAVLARMNGFGRIAVCGLIAGYQGEPMPVTQFRSILINRLKVQGFIVSEHPEEWPIALKQLGGMVAAGTLKYRETVAQGLASAPAAFLGLLKGKNVGKQLVKLID